MGRHKVERVELICKNCGKIFKRLASDIRRRRSYGNKESFCSLACVYANKRKRFLPRAFEIQSLKEKGFSLKEIGEKFGISYQRVNQILKILKEVEGG